MNNLQSNERHLADKLRNVPVPDVDQSWEQMRKLLDRDQPEGGAGWGGNKKWWWMGITAAVIMLSVWLTQQLNDSRDERIAAKQEAVNNTATTTTETASTTTVTSNNDKNATQQVSANNKSISNDITPVNKPGSNDKSSNSKELSNNKQSNNKQNDQSIKNDEEKITLNKQKNIPVIIAANNNKPVTTKTKNADKGLSTADKNSTVTEPLIGHVDQSQNVQQNVQLQTDLASTETLVEEMPEASLANNGVIKEDLAGPGTVFNSAENNSSDAIAIPGKTDRVFAHEVRQKTMPEDNRKIPRSGRGGNSGDKDHEITFAAGLAVPQSFAINGQQPSQYNVNAKPGRLPDYLPAPFFQYHINTRLFVQTELHFQSPQYTERLLLSTNTSQPSASTTLQNNVYLEKLYYFNVPFNVYYSPARNFFIGSGLQYSSLLSGVASFEQKRTENQNLTYQSVTRRFKDDSVAAKFTPSEWRYQFDANYYFKRFTLGLRYNQAMKDFVNLSPGGSAPMTIDRNRSFLLYVRFNIWEERKKGGYYSAYNW